MFKPIKKHLSAIIILLLSLTLVSCSGSVDTIAAEELTEETVEENFDEADKPELFHHETFDYEL